MTAVSRLIWEGVAKGGADGMGRVVLYMGGEME
jgi:hypothetical protein